MRRLRPRVERLERQRAVAAAPRAYSYAQLVMMAHGEDPGQPACGVVPGVPTFAELVAEAVGGERALTP